MTTTFVVAVVGRPRLPWLDSFVHMANSGGLPVDVRKCVGVADLFAQLDNGTALSAVLFDAGSPGLDRDVVVRLHVRAAIVVVVSDPHVARDWHGLGCDAVLAPDFAVVELLEILATAARAVPRPVLDLRTNADADVHNSPWLGSLITVIGSGGAGVSTVAMALAQGLGAERRGAEPRVALADFAICSEQGVLHDADPDAPGLLELIDQCRVGELDNESVYDLLLPVHQRGYDLLLGLRRRRLWTQLRQSSTAATVRALRQAYGYVVIDVDADLEGEEISGSADVEDRHQLARIAVHDATLIVAVGHASMKGMYSLARTLRDLCDYGVDPALIQPVFNHAPTGPRARSGYTAALAELTHELGLLASPVFVPIRDIDERIRSVRPLPTAVVTPLTGAVRARLGDERPGRNHDPIRVNPGFLRRGARAS